MMQDPFPAQHEKRMSLFFFSLYKATKHSSIRELVPDRAQMERNLCKLRKLALASAATRRQAFSHELRNTLSCHWSHRGTCCMCGVYRFSCCTSATARPPTPPPRTLLDGQATTATDAVTLYGRLSEFACCAAFPARGGRR